MPFQTPTMPRPNGMDTRVAKNHAEMVEMVHACKYVLMRLVQRRGNAHEKETNCGMPDAWEHVNDE